LVVPTELEAAPPLAPLPLQLPQFMPVDAPPPFAPTLDAANDAPLK
jgi:hypothetical protein